MTDGPSKDMPLVQKEKIKLIPILIGVAFVFVFAFFLYTSSHPRGSLIAFLEEGAYDFQIKHLYRPVSKDVPITIVDIDDQSLLEEGRWPWPRKKLAALVSKLYGLGATVVAFDIAFPEKENNLAEEVAKELHLSGPAESEIMQKKELFDFDGMFAKSLKEGNSILGFVFKKNGASSGILPPPLLTLNPETAQSIFITEMNTYLGNIPLFQEASKGGAFINASPDSDGVSRYSPLVLRYGNDIFPSLALEAVKQYLLYNNPQLILRNYGDSIVMEGIRLGNLSIPTDPYGRILIPFRGPPYSIPYISASDVMKGAAERKSIAGKLVFIGTSATGMGDLLATAIAPVYAGVEIHADVASGILDEYLPSKPAWGKGVSILLVLILGLGFAILLPYMGPIESTLLTFSVCGGLYFGLVVMWIKQQLVLSAVFPMITLGILYLFNLVWGYLFEKKKKRAILSIFGEYVPSEFVNQILKKGGRFSLEGETKELTVLFADIRNFTSISETMNANQLKELLNEYLTPMTRIIFEHKGTIDKYVGDMIMAFWGAPIEDPQNAFDAVVSALDMQKNLKELNQVFQKDHKAEIQIGIGINTGLMNVGDMGSKFRRAYTVIGDAVNLASRLEGISKYYHAGIVVGEETFKQTEKQIAYRKLDKVRVKGKGKAINIYEPLCILGQCDSDTLKYNSLHNQAIDNYFQQKWDESEKIFQELLKIDPPHKNLYEIYLERIDHFRKSPPGIDWDCVFVFDTK